MNIFDQNCTFTFNNLPIISLIDNKRTSSFTIQNFTNYHNNYSPPVAQTHVETVVTNESDLTELSWLTKSSLDLFKENQISSPPISAKLINLSSKSSKARAKENENENDQIIKLKTTTNNNDFFLKTSFVKLKSLNNNNNNLVDFNGDLDSSFSSSASTSSSSSLNSSNENTENFSKYFNNLESLTTIKQKFQANKDNINDGISAIKKMKLNEYFENNDKLQKQISIKIKPENEVQIHSDNNNNQVATIGNEHLNKPPLTLSCLIFMAIQESKYKCLPVREIYEWIETNFPYYKFAKTGWKSSIRHNLSFSKCFKKMDRLESCKFLTNNNQNLVNNNNSSSSSSCINSPKQQKLSNYQQRTNYVAGTCWQVNPECKSFLMQTLKKSSFWFKYNKSYPNINVLMQNYYNNEENLQQANNTTNHHHHHHHHNHHKVNNNNNNNNKVESENISQNINTASDDGYTTTEIKNEIKINEETSNSSDNENYYEMEINNKNNNFDYVSEEDDDVTRAAEILYKNSFLIKNNQQSSTINNDDSLMKNSINSDLEIEVASTLVRLKSLIEIRN